MMIEVRKSLVLLLFLSVVFGISAQNSQDPLIMEIGDRKILLSEFEAVYKKNNNQVNQKGLEEYLDLYVNFRLKVADAENLGMDTLPKFKNELSGYRKQLSEPYLSDNEVTDALIREAYERMKYEVKASHILVKVGMNDKPADTLAAYKKAEAIRKRINTVEDFARVARESSEDPSARDNGGNLGYFSALYMVYPFESAVYKSEVGKISEPVRTQFGYHLILLEDKRPNRGEMTAAHIMTRLTKESTEADKEAARMKINEIYDKLKAGGNFEELAAEFSEDKGSSAKGGILPPFSAGRMVMEFEEAAYALEKDGDYSKPVETQYGFHIIKRIGVKPLPSFEEMQPDLKMKIARDSRSRKSKMSFISRVKKEYGFKETISKRNEFYTAIDTTYFQQKWSADNVSKLNKELFRLGDSIALQNHFAKYLEQNQPRGKEKNIPAFVNRMYDQYVADFCTRYEDVRLESKYPEFKMLMKEYHDGILLFDLTDQKVWSKAVKDSVGLAAYYEAHKSEHVWGDRVEAVVYNNKDLATSKSVRKLLKERSKTGHTDADILKLANETSQLNLEIERNKFSKGDNDVVDQIQWKKGISKDITKGERIYFVEVLNLLAPQPKELNEVKGLMTSGYQNYLEDEWLKELKAKYPVKIYRENLTLIK